MTFFPLLFGDCFAPSALFFIWYIPIPQGEGMGFVFLDYALYGPLLGSINKNLLAALFDHLLGSGLYGLTPLVSTGEGPYFDWPTKKAGRTKVVENRPAATQSLFL